MSDYKGVWVKHKVIDWKSFFNIIFLGLFICLFYSWQSDWFDGLNDIEHPANQLKPMFGVVGLIALIITFSILLFLVHAESDKYEYVWERVLK